MSYKKIEELVINEFSDIDTQNNFIKSAFNGLWESEKYFIDTYFLNKKWNLLDLWCWTGRSTIPLANLWFNVTWIDIVPEMIENAIKISQENKIEIKYILWDAKNLKLKQNCFNYIFFSNQWLNQIPWTKNRNKVFYEAYRVLKKWWVFIFSTHARKINLKNILFWFNAFIKVKILKNIWFKFDEMEYWDLFFNRSINWKISTKKQFTNIPNIRKIENNLKEIWFNVVEVNNIKNSNNNSENKPYFFVCKK